MFLKRVKRAASCLVLVILVISASAQLTWRKSYGFGGSDEGVDAHQTSDGGYIATGSTGVSWQGSNAMYVVKLDAAGTPIWTKTFGSVGVEKAVACAELTDGYAIAGYSNGLNANDYDLVLLKLDVNGNEVWRKYYGSDSWEFCNSFAALSDGFILGGITYGNGAAFGNGYLVRTDLNGDTLWTSTLTGATNSEISKVIQTDDLGFLASGKQKSVNGDNNASVWKVNASGSLVWQNEFGGTDDDEFTTVMEASNGTELVAAGVSKSFSGMERMFLQGLDNSGAGTWSQNYSDGSGINDLVETHYGWYSITGFNTTASNQPDMIFTVFSPGGWFQFGNNYGANNPAAGNSIDTTTAGGYVMAGWVESIGPGPSAMYIVRIDSAGNSTSTSIDAFNDVSLSIDQLSGSEVSIQSNFLRGDTPLTLLGLKRQQPYEIIDLSGKIVQAGVTDRKINVSKLTPSQYVLRVNHLNSVLRFVIMK